MKIEGLKVFKINDWKAESSFRSDDGRTMPIPANHKVVCQDENGDIVNVTFITSVPLAFKVGDVLKGVTLAGSASKTSFGWSVKAILEK